LWHASKATALDSERARDYFRLSAELAPSFASPHAMLAYYHGLGFAADGIQRVHEPLNAAAVEARRAIALDPDDATAHAVLSWGPLCEGDGAAALECAERAISIAPSDAIAWLAKGRVLALHWQILLMRLR
jgi:adenylate cyclase